MLSKNKPAQTEAERRHVTRVKLQPCGLCGCGGGDLDPSEAHEIRQGDWFTCIALCASCHRGSKGWHGDKSLFRVLKMDEMSVLNRMLGRLYG